MQSSCLLCASSSVCVCRTLRNVCVGAHRRQAGMGRRCSHLWWCSTRPGLGCKLHGVGSVCANWQPCSAFATVVLHSRLILACSSLPVSTSIPSFVVSVSSGIPVMHICHKCFSLVFSAHSFQCSWSSCFLLPL